MDLTLSKSERSSSLLPHFFWGSPGVVLQLCQWTCRVLETFLSKNSSPLSIVRCFNLLPKLFSYLLLNFVYASSFFFNTETQTLIEIKFFYSFAFTQRHSTRRSLYFELCHHTTSLVLIIQVTPFLLRCPSLKCQRFCLFEQF